VNRSSIALLALFALILGGCATAFLDPGSSNPNPNPGPQPFALTITPSSMTLRGLATQQFVAKTNDGSTPSFTWTVNGVGGGTPENGTIDAKGNYAAPEFLPASNPVTIAATVTSDASKTATSTVTLQNPIPVLDSISPNTLTVGSFTLTLTGAHFAPGATVYFGSTALTTTRISSTQLTATGTTTSNQVGNVSVTVTNPNPGGATSAALQAQIMASNPNLKVQVIPPTATLVTDGLQTFTATVTGTTNTGVTWMVNGIAGGDQVGTIDVNGNYIAPDNIPSPSGIQVTATSIVDTTKSGSAQVTLNNPAPVLTSVTPGTLATGAFQVTLNGTGLVNTSTVNFGGQSLPVTYAAPTMVTAIGSVTPAQAGSITVTVTNPAPGGGTSNAVSVNVTTGGTPVSASSAVRFLEQVSFGPNTETLNQVQTAGFDLYLQNQFAAAVTPYRDPKPNGAVYDVQRLFFLNAVAGGDQLRQRVASALNELWVVAGDKVSDPLGYTNYMRTLEQDALGNYLNVMKDVTLTPAMGNYLDMVNNDKPAAGQHANENYAREIMQLFSLGLNQLNPDGTPVLDASGNPVPTYTQDDVMNLGRAFTGWTYPTTPGQSLQQHNPQYYGGPMVPYEANHDNGAKTLLGQPIAAGLSAEAELSAALNIIFNHPNVGPFVSQQLILRLVTSNPSPAYVQRVAQAFNTGSFNGYGSGTRGDLQATVAAVLLDPEARRGDSPATAVATDGKLREPIVMEVSIARAFHAQTDAGGFSNEGSNMAQNVFYAPTVFNFFPPVSPIAGTTLNGPEFAIFNTDSSLSRVNFIDDAVYGAIGSNTHLDFTPVINAGTPDQMLAWLDALFLHGTMPDQMKQVILPAMNTLDPADTQGQAQVAIYLVTSSSMYQVQH